jgi:hypothetical protein
MYQSWRKTYSGVRQSGSGFIASAGNGGGGSDFVTDTFTTGSDVNLSSHAGEVGATWTLHTLYSGVITDDAALDRIYLTSAGAAAYHASGTPPGADYYVSATLFRLTQIPTNVSLILGMDTTADTGILLRLNDTGGAVQWEVIDRVAGSNTILNGGAAVTGAHVPSLGGAGVLVKLVRTGTAITVFFDGVQDTALNCTTSITAVGKAGVRCSGQASSATGIHIDDFTAR